MSWPNNSILELFNIKLPIVQAPMAGANDLQMALAVAQVGGLGSLPCAMSSPDKISEALSTFRKQSTGPLNLNFFCHQSPQQSSAHVAKEDDIWRQALQKFYLEYGLDATVVGNAPTRVPFGEEMCVLVEAYRPEIVSFHFGLPDSDLLQRVKAADCKVMSSATSVAEAIWLEEQGVDAVIAQGYEAGGHQGMFLSNDISTQVGTLSLVPQVVDVVRVPVIAAGGIADGRGVAAAFALGAAGVQIGTAYLLSKESLISQIHKDALWRASADATALTNVFSGKPARGVMNRLMRELGPMSQLTPKFPTAGTALLPLKKAAESRNLSDFSSLWSGQGIATARKYYADDSAGGSVESNHPIGAAEITQQIMSDALQNMKNLSR